MLQTAVVVGSCSCESCAGQGMLLPLGKPRSLSRAQFKRDLNATFSPDRFLQCVPFLVPIPWVHELSSTTQQSICLRRVWWL